MLSPIQNSKTMLADCSSLAVDSIPIPDASETPKDPAPNRPGRPPTLLVPVPTDADAQDPADQQHQKPGEADVKATPHPGRRRTQRRTRARMEGAAERMTGANISG